MYFGLPTRSDILLAASYFGAASLALALTRFDSGVAFLWLAASMLIPYLAQRRRRDWGTPMLLCAGASTIATGLFGLGWALALPFACINMIEAYIGAGMLARRRSNQHSMVSLDWFWKFIFSVGVVAPLVAGTVAAAALAEAGRPFGETLIKFWAGHALGNLTFIPILTLVVSGELARLMRGFTGPRLAELALLLTLVAAVTAGAFSQSGLPLLFLPCGPIILAIFRSRQVGAALSIALLALIGGGMTIAGHGPVQLIDAPLGARMQFFQFYLASVVLTVLPVAADLKNRSRLYRALRFSEARYRLLADNSSDIMMHLECDGTIRFVSPSIRQLGGYDPDLMVGRRAIEFVAADDVARVSAAHLATIEAAGETLQFDYRAINSDGGWSWYETRSRAIVDRHGVVDGVLSVIRDVSDRKSTEQRLTEAALTDPLTALPNRRAFRVAVEDVAFRADAMRGCIALVDLDHFKQVNDQHGHDGGDSVLCQFAAQARDVLGMHDVIARMGGEEFAVWFPGVTVEDALVRCEQLRLAIAGMGVPSATGLIRVTISCGLAELGEDGLDPALKRADLALYQAKAGGRDQLALAA